MPAATVNFKIEQGATFSKTVQVNRANGTPWNLTTPGTTVAAKIRRKFSDSAALASFTITNTDPTNGAFTMSLTAVETAALTAASGQPNADSTRELSLGVHDLEFTEGGVVTRIIQGAVTLSQEATK